MIRDGATGELVLEGGALVLADKGICASTSSIRWRGRSHGDPGDGAADRPIAKARRRARPPRPAPPARPPARPPRRLPLAARPPPLPATPSSHARLSRPSRRRASRRPSTRARRCSPPPTALLAGNPTKTPEGTNLPAASSRARPPLAPRPLDLGTDKRLAEHVVYVHRNESPARRRRRRVRPPPRLRLARAPVRAGVTPEVSEYIVDEYVAIAEANENEATRRFHVGAHAARSSASRGGRRLRCAHEVVREDIVEARRLMTLSKSSIYDAADGDADGAKNKVDPVSVVSRSSASTRAPTGCPPSTCRVRRRCRAAARRRTSALHGRVRGARRGR